MKQYEERNYAPKVRKKQKQHISQYSNGSESRQASETSCCNSLQRCREEQEENEIIDVIIETYAKVEEQNITQGKKMKKEAAKEKNHEAKEMKAHEKKEEKKEHKSKKK